MTMISVLDERNLKIQKAAIEGQLKEIAKQQAKIRRKAEIWFYKEELEDMGYRVYFWDPVKAPQFKEMRDAEINPFYRVCFAYKIEGGLLTAFVSFCHPEDNFDRLLAWRDLYNQANGKSQCNKIYPQTKVEDKKGQIYNILRKGVVTRPLWMGRKPSLFKQHCKTLLKDV